MRARPGQRSGEDLRGAAGARSADDRLPAAARELGLPSARLVADGLPYGDWLVAVFERWRSARPRETRVRLFNEIIRQLCGSPSRSESIGLAPVAVVVVETDGGIEQIDTLKSAYDGATRTPLHVLRNSFDEALFEPAIVARQIGRDALSETCLSCDLAGICGGGLYPHRYRSGSGFRNPSVYSRDLYRLITHIRSALREELAAPASRPSPAEA
ncbi:hypothetical protein ACFQQB_18695 [Nonomuraea rubra]|uniref:hypothetical protein n=1 Tax=Nonomuraea rubra TaxID=46180 RepID=UPI00360FAF43